MAVWRNLYNEQLHISTNQRKTLVILLRWTVQLVSLARMTVRRNAYRIQL